MGGEKGGGEGEGEGIFEDMKGCTGMLFESSAAAVFSAGQRRRWAGELSLLLSQMGMLGRVEDSPWESLDEAVLFLGRSKLELQPPLAVGVYSQMVVENEITSSARGRQCLSGTACRRSVCNLRLCTP